MSSPTVLVFGESRLSRDERGYHSLDRGTAGRAWTRGLEGVPGLGLAVRVDSVTPVSEGSRPVEVNHVEELPYYVGVRAMLRVLPRLVRAVDAAVSHADVVVARLPGLVGLLAVAASSKQGKPLAVEMVGDVRDVLGSGTLGPVGRVATSPMRIATQWAMRQADVARYMTQRTLQGRYPVRPGVPTVGASSVQLDDSWAIHPDSVTASAVRPPVILAIGSQEQLYKGHDILIEALPIVLRAHPGARLVLVGQGRMQNHLRKMADALGVGGSVEFAGYVSDRDALRTLIDRCDVFCMPSRTEGLPRALVEAMARGRMALGAPVGGIPELIADDCLVDPEDVAGWADAISRALVDPGRREFHGQLNARAARPFTASALQPQLATWRQLVIDLAQDPS